MLMEVQKYENILDESMGWASLSIDTRKLQYAPWIHQEAGIIIFLAMSTIEALST